MNPAFLDFLTFLDNQSYPCYTTQNLIPKQKTPLHRRGVTIRSMPVNVPKDTPTHQFKAEDMLSKWQKFIRKSSLDELPQLFCIWIGTMAIVGPRPALWNQDDLVAERDKYGANNIKPGLTGWAQIHGRDEIEIPLKAKYDGEYTAKLKEGGFKAFGFDIRCFFCSIISVLKSDGVVEGGTGTMHQTEDMSN